MKAICIKEYDLRIRNISFKKGEILNMQDNNKIFYKDKFVCDCGSLVFIRYFEVYDDTAEKAKKVFEVLGLEEGKIYEADGLINDYRIIEGELQSKYDKDWSCAAMSLNNTFKYDFVEVDLPFEERIEIGDNYYYINRNFEPSAFGFDNDSFDRKLIRAGNFFETEEEIMKAIEEIKITLGNINKGECN
jgi:hypothetical protein